MKWKRGSDNVTTQANLRYRVRWKKKSGGGWQTSHGDFFTNFPKDMTSYTITGLEPNTEYQVYVTVFDEAMNYQSYGQKTVTTAADTEKPKAGCNGKITIGTVTTNSIALSWCAATDNVTPHSRMKYTYTYNEGFGAGGFPPQNEKTGTAITSGTITGLKPGTKYTVWVYATDEAGNENYGPNTDHIQYQSVNVETKPAPDTQAPTPGGYQSGYPKATGTTTIEVKWTRATDNVTAPANLRYRVSWKKKSGGSWQYSHSEPFTNFPKDWTSYTITGLEPNTEYLVDVRVVDEANERQWYGQKTVKTPAGAGDTQAPTAPVITSLTSTQTTITATWAPSTDNVTPQNEIEYVVWYGISGYVLPKYPPKGATSYTLSGLEPGKEYTILIRAKDAAGNYTDGPEKKIKTKAAADTQDPTPGGYEAGYPKATGPGTIEVKWKRATDNVTAPANLRYVVGWAKKSGGSWQYSHPEPFTNYPKDWTSYTITGLQPNTEYVVNVLVVDEAGNWKFCGPKTVTTGAAAVTIPVTGVTLSPASLNLEVGATKSLTHTVLPATATNKTVTWSSSNTAIATVDGSGTRYGHHHRHHRRRRKNGHGCRHRQRGHGARGQSNLRHPEPKFGDDQRRLRGDKAHGHRRPGHGYGPVADVDERQSVGRLGRCHRLSDDP
ncbi:fibronectin type III domain-containing protein [Tannerella forsythia]|uniref:fibronectin type III domain-containing protein n=1 Tax=Tannerella forsythia TaxID=28112 RepID=UPI0021AB77BE|nr:fibronectin type III domain-containing protein [Tannerella forsythia]